MAEDSKYTAALQQAAALWGIEPEYWDIWGRRHVTSAETIRAILGAMGVPAGGTAELEQAIKARVGRELGRLVPPCLVISENARPRELPVNA